jgi:hypothetical protein
MTSIHELSEQQEHVKNLMFFLSSDDPDDANDIALAEMELNKIRGDAKNTALFLNKICQELRDVADKRKDKYQSYGKLWKTADNAYLRLKNRITDICVEFGIDKVVDEYGEGLRLQLSPGSLKYAENFDYSTLPIHCRKTVFEPINKEVKELIMEGVDIPGVEIVKSVGIRSV